METNFYINNGIVFFKASVLVLLLSLCNICWGQENCSLDFNGHWSVEKSMDIFKDFTLKYGYKRSKSLIQVEIESVLNGEPDPSPEQIKTYEYICNNQEIIRSVLLDSSKVYFQEYFEMTFDDPDVFDAEDTVYLNPLVLEQLMTPLEIHILSDHKDGYAYYGIGGHCVWELDEGFGFLMHKDRVIEADVIFVAYEKGPAMKDNGTYEKFKSQQKLNQLGTTLEPKPQLYTPHPKYGILKPIEEYKNGRYVHDLVAYGYTEDVISMHKKSMINIQYKRGNHIINNLLKTAVIYNQKELVSYFFSQPDLDHLGLIQHAAKNLNKEMVLFLLDNGIDINERNSFSQTALDVVRFENRPSHFYFNTQMSEDVDSFKDWLKQLGAKTEEEIFKDLISKRNFDGIKSFMKIKSQRASGYIYNAIRLNDDEMAMFLFTNTKFHGDSMRFETAIKYKSQKMIKYCLDRGMDINTKVRGNLPLDELRKSKEYTKGESLEALIALENWMISKGAVSKK